MDDQGSSSGPRCIIITHALHRPALLLGAERAWVLMTGLISAALIFISMSALSIITGSALWFGALALLRRMAKADPIMTVVYQRHIKYRAYYPPRSHPKRSTL